MELPSDLISEFVKATKPETTTKKETIVYGTVVMYNGKKYVKLDGSPEGVYTPVATTAGINENDRVTVVTKDHTAIVTGNLSSPSAGAKEVEEISDKVSKFEGIIADSVTAEELEVEKGRIDNLIADNVLIREELTAAEADISKIEADNVTINEKLVANEAEVKRLDAEKIDASTVEADYAKLGRVQALEGEFHTLESTYGEFAELTADELNASKGRIDKLETEKLSADQADLKYATIGELEAVSAEVTSLDARKLTAEQADLKYATIKNLEAMSAEVDELDAKKLSADQADLKYANIDFSNIDKSTMEWFYANSGLIDNVKIGDATISGELIGVTIKGDLIEGNTIKADKLVVKGSNGLYYKLNIEAGAIASAEVTEEELQNGLHGSTIIAKTITAEQISVQDLVAFDATIGGFTITDEALYSGVKESVDNATRGTYLDNDGQVAFGDGNNYIKYYRMSDGTYKLDISASSIRFGSSGKNVENAIQEAVDAATVAQETATNAQQTANTAKTNAANAQSKADAAATAAANAQKAADDADAKAAQAAADLATAEQNLEEVRAKADATEEEVRAAQEAVETAQAAANQAKSDAQAAQSTANAAKTAANDAQESADSAGMAAAEAQNAADDAKQAVEALAVRVSTAETSITQNAEQIALRATKEEVVETLGGYSTKEETAAAIEIAANEITSTVSKSYEATASRGEQLVTNGNGLLGDNTNFSVLRFDGSQSNNSPGSFTRDTITTNYYVFTDEFVPVNPDKRYTLRFDAKSQNGLATMYSMLVCYDVDKNEIRAADRHYVAGTLTTLSQDLKNGDTVVHLTDASSWQYKKHAKYVSIWNYTNSFGYTYPAETYTRNHPTISNTSNTLNDGAIDYDNNTITLQSAWTGGTVAAGTQVSQGRDAAGYVYIGATGAVVPTSWTSYEGSLQGVDYSSSDTAKKFPPGTAYCKVGFLWNYNQVNDYLWATNITLMDTTADNDLSSRITNAETSITQHSGKIALCATKTEVDTQVTNAINSVEIGGRNLITLIDLSAAGFTATITSTDNIVCENVSQWAISALLFANPFPAGEYTLNFSETLQDGTFGQRVGLISSVQLDSTWTYNSYYDTEYSRSYVKYFNTWPIALALTQDTLLGMILTNEGNVSPTRTITGLKLEKGNKATDWTPAPEDVDSDIAQAQYTADTTSQRVTTAEARIDLVSDAINAMVAGENGESILTQTEDGWVFSMKDLTDAVDDLKNNVSSLQTDSEQAKSDVDALKQTIDDHGSTLEYVRVITDQNDNPCIELGESDSDFKHLITNKASQIMDGDNVVTEMDTDGVESENVTVRNELRQGQWAWVVHGGGNIGLMWKEVSD